MKTPVILCVDDEQMLLDAIKQQLNNCFGKNYQIETAESGEEALEVVEELLEDKIELPLVISDHIMPGMKGDELLTHIHAIAPKTLKVLLTGQANVEAVGRTVNKANLYRYIAKPWEITDFNLTVTEAIRRYFQEKKLAQRTLELQQKNEFLSMAVHDLKNPLSVIQTVADMVKNYFNEMSKEQIIDLMDNISTGSRQMFDLVTDILEINAIESDKKNLSLNILNLQPILQGFVKRYDEKAKEKDIQLHFEYQEEPHSALVDDHSIRRVFDNLFSNAIKFSPYNKPIYVRLNQNKNYIRCEIQDEGPGLSDADQQKLYGQFTRLTPKPTGGEHSTGLGLFIVKKLVETMHGKIGCESILGQGTTFFVEFLVADESKINRKFMEVGN
ncbi:hybrid sensor histidine kinase/response regulator [Candidatus Parabeggiatoa sp. HSG14]|uniref:hybrid sensor histidine kinase/response regulator n=1 Tax=Candidatus Parabeggiatoa sp. HSG14 TaxID=3055593 RepID=UPI0025A79A21|nr:hybrid sensor histidine kinase/response regulator [Thiotrichales bacterium HSG14]